MIKCFILLLAALALFGCAANPAKLVDASSIKVLSAENYLKEINSINIVRTPFDYRDIPNASDAVKNLVTYTWNNSNFDGVNRFGGVIVDNLKANSLKIGYQGVIVTKNQLLEESQIRVLIRCKEVSFYSKTGPYFIVTVTVSDAKSKTRLFEYEDVISAAIYSNERNPCFDTFTFNLLNLLKDRGLLARSDVFVISK